MKVQSSFDNKPARVTFTRGEMSESVHYVRCCIVDSSGSIRLNYGRPDFTTYLRSTCKPFQAMGVVLSGAVERFGLSRKEIALICGSHGGEPIHTEAVEALLARAGLGLKNLKCGIHWPLDETARNDLIRKGLTPGVEHHNCSGKHSGMLLSALCLGEDPDLYLDVAGAVQRRIVTVIAKLAAMKEGEIIVGTDGCSAPAHAIPLYNAAFAFARLVEPRGLPNDLRSGCEMIADSMRSHPEMVAASNGRICTELMRASINGTLIAKAGAEGFYGAGWIDTASGKGMGMVVKVEDGAQRARNPLVVHLLQKFGQLPPDLPPTIMSFAAGPIVNNAGIKTGEIRVHIDTG